MCIRTMKYPRKGVSSSPSASRPPVPLPHLNRRVRIAIITTTGTFNRHESSFVFAADSARRMADSEASMLSELIHGADDVFSAMQWYETMPDHAPDTLCYFFCWKGFKDVRWVVAPWGELGEECGFILAANASFYCNIDEYSRICGACH